MGADVFASCHGRAGGGGGPASALRTAPSGRLPSAQGPAARPERFRKVGDPDDRWRYRLCGATLPWLRGRSDFLISTDVSLIEPDIY